LSARSSRVINKINSKGVKAPLILFNINNNPSTIFLCLDQERVRYAIKYLKSRNLSVVKPSTIKTKRVFCNRNFTPRKEVKLKSNRRESATIEYNKLYSIKYFGIVNGEIGVLTKQVPLPEYRRTLTSRSLNKTFQSPLKIKTNTTKAVSKNYACRFLRIEVKKKPELCIKEEDRPATAEYSLLNKEVKEWSMQTEHTLFTPQSSQRPQTESLAKRGIANNHLRTLNMWALSLKQPNIGDKGREKVKFYNKTINGWRKRADMLNKSFIERRKKRLRVLNASIINLPIE